MNNFWAAGRKHSILITGASSGIGTEFALMFAKMGHFVILNGRNIEALNSLKKQIGEDKCEVIAGDLSDTKSCIDLYARAKKYSPDVLINNAGFGIYGEFTETSLKKELEMIDVNIKAVHILFKLFLKDFAKNNNGFILNVASSAGIMPGPLMSTYYSTKSYVIRQSVAVYTELKAKKSNVGISVLCPGPVSTEFNKRAGISGFFKGITAKQCVYMTFNSMRKGKLIIIPTIKMKLLTGAARLAPIKLASFGAYVMQKGKKRIEEEK